MPVIKVVDLNKIKIAPAKKISVGANSTYWFQRISYGEDGDLLLQSPKFRRRSSVVKSNFDDSKKLVLSKDLFPSLAQIELLASDNYDLDVISDPQKKFDQAKEAYFKHMNADNIFVKFSKDFIAFDANKKPYSGAFGYGWYKVILHVVGIYIGQHGTGPEKASLQLRVKQVMFNPIPYEEPLFLDSDDDDMDDMDENDEDEMAPLLKRRRASLTKLNQKPFKWIEESHDVAHLQDLYESNNYPSQQPTENEQLQHDAYLAALRKRIDFLMEHE